MGAGSDGKAAGQAPRLDHLLHLNVDDDDDYLGVDDDFVIRFENFNKNCNTLKTSKKMGGQTQVTRMIYIGQ